MKTKLRGECVDGLRMATRRVSHVVSATSRALSGFRVGLTAARMANAAFGSGKPDISELP